MMAIYSLIDGKHQFLDGYRYDLYTETTSRQTNGTISLYMASRKFFSLASLYYLLNLEGAN